MGMFSLGCWAAALRCSGVQCNCLWAASGGSAEARSHGTMRLLESMQMEAGMAKSRWHVALR